MSQLCVNVSGMEHNDDDAPAPLSLEGLAARLDESDQQQKKAHKRTFWDAVAVSFGAVAICAMAVGMWIEFGPQPGPTSADDQLDSLLRPGPHCYSSSAEMAAARQRALTATDRMRWEEDFTRRWNEEHRPQDTNNSMIPGPVAVAAPAPTIPTIAGPNDTGVPPSTDPNLAVNDELCFGVTESGD